MLALFVRRPILSLVINIFIVLLGLLAITTLPVTQFPDIVPPSVIVTAKYTGANAEVCAKAVATPIERAINGVPGMTYMTTVTSNNGVTLIQVFFKVGVDPDVAAVSVQNRVTSVLDELPEEVVKAGVTAEKEVNAILMYLNILSDDTTDNEQFVYNFAHINIISELKRIDGVGFCEILGNRNYSMRIWLKPDRMTAYNLSTDELITLIREQNVEAAPGKTGQSSGFKAQSQEYVLRYTGKFNQLEQFEDLVIRANPDGSVLRLSDVADIDFGSFDYSMISRTNGRPSASIMVKQRPGSNAKEVISKIKEKMDELKTSSFPPSMKYNIVYDVSRFLDASIQEVIKTLIEAFILVFLVVFIFLQDFRSTLIPAIAVPVSLVGTFTFMQLFGFSINLLTLFALVLAIGIVVDNAIVVVESVHFNMHTYKLNAQEATLRSLSEIGGAIFSITLVMSAVFIPVAFLSGPVGIFYRQFSITMAISIVISGINALTLTPALCALLLKENHHTNSKSFLGKFFNGFNKWYDNLSDKYVMGLKRFSGKKRLVIAATLSIFVLIAVLIKWVPGGFIPTEDQGLIYLNLTTPPGSTVERTQRALDAFQKKVGELKEIETISTLGGYSLITESSGASYGMGLINLLPWSERDRNMNQIIDELYTLTRDIPDAKFEFFPPPTVPGFGNASGFEMRLIDKTGANDLGVIKNVTDSFLMRLQQRKEIKSAFTGFDPTFPQYIIHVDQNLAAKNGVTIDNAMSTLQTLIGSYYASNFLRFGQMYKVMLQALPEYRTTPESILKLYTKNNRGEMVPFSNFITLERVYGPEQLTRYNMFTSAMINGEAKEGYSSGDAVKAITEVAKETFPKGFNYEWTGITREEVAASGEATVIFLLVIIFVYLLLAAQYESLLLPLPVLLTVPSGIFGGLLFLKFTGLEYNIYAQVAFVMLIGLLGKNAILIVEFAKQLVERGSSVFDAALTAAQTRLKPILMTSLAFIVGLIPLTIASGAGALGNRSIGTSAAGGMLIGTLAGIVLIPGLFIVFSSIKKHKNKQPK